MVLLRFGSAARQLCGVLHPGDSRRQPALGVLLCNPFGQEAVRTHRMYRVLADRLATAGAYVLRFDYHGTGESAGDDLHGELQGWCDDIVSADRELHGRATPAQTVWVGARLGASLAAAASPRVGRALDRLVLWEPVLDGRRYLAELASAHARALAEGGHEMTSPVEAQPHGEALGFAMSASLLQQLERWDAAPPAAARAREAVVIASARDAAGHDLARRLDANGVPCGMVEFDHVFDWTSDEALNTALVPPAAIRLLIEQIDRPFR
jgi:alpha-beta hydrolase superfamily lysophospholipase